MLRTKVRVHVVLPIEKASASLHRTLERFRMHMNVLGMPPQFCLSLKLSFVLANLPSASDARIIAAIVASSHRAWIGLGVHMNVLDMLPQLCVLLKMPFLLAVHPTASKAFVVAAIITAKTG